MSDDEEIYAAPAEQDEVKVTSVANLKRAFEQKKIIPIQVATDGRFQNKENIGNKPKPATKPKPGAGTSLPDLPLKKSQLRAVNQKPLLPPGVKQTSPSTDVTSQNSGVTSPLRSASGNGAEITQNGTSSASTDTNHMTPPPGSAQTHVAKTRRSSDRESIYPPKRANTTKLSKPETPNHIISGLATDLNGYRLKKLPPAPKPAAPTKPPAIDVDLDMWTDVYDQDEIYDDIVHDTDQAPPIVRNEDDDLPPPPMSMLARPISVIPDMTEDEEFRELGSGRKAPMATIPSNDEIDEETYDDVAVGSDELADDAIDDDIYQEI